MSSSPAANTRRPHAPMTGKRPSSSYSKSPHSAPLGSKKLKKEIKHLKWIILRPELPADVRRNSERKIKALEIQLANIEKGRKEAKFADKYKYVRFVEQKKVTRTISNLTKELSALPETDPKHADLTTSLRESQISLSYITHFPKDVKYVALFPSGEPAIPTNKKVEEERMRRTERIRIAVWSACEKAVEEGSVDGLALSAKDVLGGGAEVSRDGGEDGAGELGEEKKKKKARKEGAGKAIKKEEMVPVVEVDDFFLEDFTPPVEAKDVVVEEKEVVAEEEVNVAEAPKKKRKRDKKVEMVEDLAGDAQEEQAVEIKKKKKTSKKETLE